MAEAGAIADEIIGGGSPPIDDATASELLAMIASPEPATRTQRAKNATSSEKKGAKNAPPAKSAPTAKAAAGNGVATHAGNGATVETKNETKAETKSETTTEVKVEAKGAAPKIGARAPRASRAKKATATAPRPRGRPPSKPPAPVVDLYGVVEAPDDPENRMELASSNPAMFKSLFTYFKNLKAKTLFLHFDRAGLTVFTRDHTKTARVVAVVSGEKLNWYYCESEFDITIVRDNVEKIIATIDKSFFKVSFLYRHDDPDSLYIVFKNSPLKKECRYKIAVAPITESDEELFAARALVEAEALAKYPLEFCLGTSDFKKSVTDALNVNASGVINVEKFGESPLAFTYNCANTAYSETYDDGAAIGLRSLIADGSAFRCTLRLANVKSLTSSINTEKVTIYCQQEGDIVFATVDDKALAVYTLTKTA